jgi:hypothetical protein
MNKTYGYGIRQVETGFLDGYYNPPFDLDTIERIRSQYDERYPENRHVIFQADANTPRITSENRLQMPISSD